MRTSPPVLLTENRSRSEPGTRSMSPNEQKMTPSRDAISNALSIVSSGVTQTGQPGPWTISMSSGRRRSMPLRMIEWVWPPHTSISTWCFVVISAMSSRSRRARSGSRNSSRYFTRRPWRLLLPPRAPRRDRVRLPPLPSPGDAPVCRGRPSRRVG